MEEGERGGSSAARELRVSHCDFGTIDYETLRRSSLNSLLLCVDLASPLVLWGVESDDADLGANPGGIR